VAIGRNSPLTIIEFGRPVCCLGSDVTQKVFNNEDASGSGFEIDGQNYTVVGVLAPKGTSFGGNPDNFVMIPITRFCHLRRQYRSIASIQAPSQADLSATQDKAIE